MCIALDWEVDAVLSRCLIHLPGTLKRQGHTHPHPWVARCPSATRPPARVNVGVILWIAKPTVENESSWYCEGPFCHLPTYPQGGSLSSPQCAGVFRRASDGAGLGATWEALHTVVMCLWAFRWWRKRGHFWDEPWGRKWRGYWIKSRHKIYG